MARIGIDIDGVCYDFVDALRNYIHKKTGRPLHEMPDSHHWLFFQEEWGYSVDEYHKFIHEGVLDLDIFWRGKIYEGCKESLEYLFYKLNHEIVFITARVFDGIKNYCKYATEYWVMSHGLPYSCIIVDNDKTNKPIDILFDDSIYQIESRILHGEKAVIFDRPWNQEETHVERVLNWEDLVRYVEEKF
jgi:5'(3')-deoxyribonucleotidase